MKRHYFAALAASLFLLPATAFAESKSLDTDAFHGVDAASGIRVIVTGGQPLSVVADSADARTLADLRYQVRDGVLQLWYDWTLGDIFDWSKRDITVTIGTELLDVLEASSGASIEATALMGEDIHLEASSGGGIRTDAIEGMFYRIESSSGARIETSGFCTTAEIEVSSGASVAAKGLDCGKVTLEVSSGGHATVFGGPKVEHLETSSGGGVDFPA
jgi:hypothetical protein